MTVYNVTLPGESGWGSDATAASGGKREQSDVRPQAPCKRATAQRAALSESLWPWSADDEGISMPRKMPGTTTGNDHRLSWCEFGISKSLPSGLIKFCLIFMARGFCFFIGYVKL